MDEGNRWLTDGLQALGINPGDRVLVHTSMKGLGHVHGGADGVIDALIAAVGEQGTVFFPTLTGGAEDGPENPPVITLASTSARHWVGVVPEAARQRSNAVRSIHPTHSVTAIGSDAVEWTGNHELGQSPCDQASPYFRLMEEGGKILLLGGVTHESNTSLHCIEELADVPYHLQDDVTEGVVILPNGQHISVRNRLHLWQNRYRHKNLTRDFNVVNEPLNSSGVQHSAQIGKSRSTLIDAGGMRDVLVPLLAENPLFLLRSFESGV